MASKYVYRRHLPADYVRLLTLVSDGENFHGSLEEFRRDNLPYFNPCPGVGQAEENNRLPHSHAMDNRSLSHSICIIS